MELMIRWLWQLFSRMMAIHGKKQQYSGHFWAKLVWFKIIQIFYWGLTYLLIWLIRGAGNSCTKYIQLITTFLGWTFEVHRSRFKNNSRKPNIVCNCGEDTELYMILKWVNLIGSKTTATTIFATSYFPSSRIWVVSWYCSIVQNHENWSLPKQLGIYIMV